MKKNKMMRLASALLVLTLLTTCVISGTFAKYVTADAGTDTARVAKWGVTVNVQGLNNAFAEEYNTDDTTTYTEAKSVSSLEAGKDILAPGTKGSMTAIQITGKPEVAVKVTYKADLELVNWEVIGVNKYCPIIFYINEVQYKIALGTDADELETLVENAINNYSKVYGPKTDLSGENADYLKIRWEWPFEVNDVADTALGNQAATGTAATITLTLTCTVTQVD